MRILLTTIFKYPQLGGVSNYITNLKKSLIDKGYNVSVLSISNANDMFTTSDWQECDDVYRNLSQQFGDTVHDVAIKWELFRYIYTKMLKIYVEEFDIIHTQDVFTIDILKERYPSIPIIATPHASLVEEVILEGHCNYGDMLINFAEIHNKNIAKADHVIAISKYISKRLCSDLGEDKITIVHTGINKFDKDYSKKKTNDIPEIVATSRLMPIKGIDVLLEALSIVNSQNRKCNCTILGDGMLMDSLKDYSQKLKLSNVNFVGATKNVSDYLYSADIFVLPSRSENFPLALLEAMFSKCAIIATKVGGIPEIISHGEDGLLVDANSSVDLSNALISFIDDKNLRNEFAQLSYEKALDNYSTDVMINKIIEVYKKEIEKF